MKVAIIISIFVLTPFIIITAFRKYQLAKNIGTVIMAYTVGIFLSFLFSFTDFLSAAEAITLSNIQKTLMNVTVPLAIPLMLFSSDFKMWSKSLPKTLIALITGIAAVLVAVLVSFFLFKDSGITTFSKVAAMMAGFYNGGSMNFFAVGQGLNVDETLITITLTSEMIIVFPFLIFLTAGGYKLFRWLLPFKDGAMVVTKADSKDPNLTDIENYDGMLTKKVFPKTMLGFLLSLSFLIVGAGLSLLITGGLNELVIILTITTLAIASSFNKKIRSLPRTFELGMFFILIFSIIVASQFDPVMFKDEALQIFLFVLSITLIAIILHLILCRIFKIPGDLYSVAIVGMLCSPPFIPPIVAAMGNRKVLISGITIGLVGYAIGTYIGVGMYYLLELF
ncbi:MAG: DUF819 family protein [Bacteroidetes bacterium]|nr:DUF819 family protein [Bacteroidota bacterium]MCL2302840.1 DUF819 family protein [Lentimicrobiaceae bacterium]